MTAPQLVPAAVHAAGLLWIALGAEEQWEAFLYTHVANAVAAGLGRSAGLAAPAAAATAVCFPVLFHWTRLYWRAGAFDPLAGPLGLHLALLSLSAAAGAFLFTVKRMTDFSSYEID